MDRKAWPRAIVTGASSGPTNVSTWSRYDGIGLTSDAWIRWYTPGLKIHTLAAQFPA